MQGMAVHLAILAGEVNKIYANILAYNAKAHDG